MAENVTQVKPAGGILPLSNIAIAERAVARLLNRSPLDPGLVTISGPSGYGKSIAAARISAVHNTYYVQADDYWTKKNMLQKICQALGISPKYRGKDDKRRAYWPEMSVMADEIKAQLEKSRRILIIDEFDYVVDKDLVMAVLSLYEGSKASILIIGEEALPIKLKAWEKFHGRILDWFMAERASLADARLLAEDKCAGVHIADDLLEHLCEITDGSTRRVSTNLGAIYDVAADQGWDAVDLSRWGNRALQTNEPKRRGAYAA